MTFLCGASVRDFSPTEDMLPLAASYRQSYTSVAHPLHVRAIALNDGNHTALIMNFELGSVPDADILLNRIAEESGVAKEYIFAAGTHAHAAPFSPRMNFFPRRNVMPSYDEEGRKKLEAFFDRIHVLAVEAAKEAVAQMKPAIMKYAFGESWINVNRNQDYVLHGNYQEALDEFQDNFAMKVRKVNGRTVLTMLGINPKGPSDKTLSVVKFEGEDGAPIAWFINHSTHSVVMHMNLLHALSSDFSGETARLMEKEFPGSVAVWTAGSSGDQNPVIMSNNYVPVPETGMVRLNANNADPLDLVDRVAGTHFDDILKTIDNMNLADETTIRCAKDYAKPVSTNPEKEFNIGMTLLQIGPINLIGVSGELYTSIGQHLKKESNSNKTIIVSYHSALGENGVGYILDDDGLERGGWGWSRWQVKHGSTVTAMTETMKNLFHNAK